MEVNTEKDILMREKKIQRTVFLPNINDNGNIANKIHLFIQAKNRMLHHRR